MDGFTNPSLWEYIGDDLDEFVLDPVRAIRLYLERSKIPRSKELGHLLSLTGDKKDVHKDTISFGLCETIKGHTNCQERRMLPVRSDLKKPGE